MFYHPILSSFDHLFTQSLSNLHASPPWFFMPLLNAIFFFGVQGSSTPSDFRVAHNSVKDVLNIRRQNVCRTVDWYKTKTLKWKTRVLNSLVISRLPYRRYAWPQTSSEICKLTVVNNCFFISMIKNGFEQLNHMWLGEDHNSTNLINWRSRSFVP